MNDEDSKQRNKIQELEQLADLLVSKRAQGKQVVQCHGVFDLLHIGHIRHLQQAKQMGDLLVVTITPDQYVNKGPDRPAFTEGLRAAAISALECVDYVAINKAPTAVDAIGLIKPKIYAKGAEYRNPDNDMTNKIGEEEAAVKLVGGEIGFTDDQVVFSSTNLINRHWSVFPKEVKDYLFSLSKRHPVDEVLGYLDNAAKMKTLVIGETIIDEYEYTEAMGSSSKEPILATRYVSSEKFAGGILAVANHVANFCGEVDVLTFLGTDNSQEDFARRSLNPNVTPVFFYKSDSPTIVKRRYVENYLLRKLFEVYVMKDGELSEGENQELCAKLEELLPTYDLVIVADYGHGMLTREAREVLGDKSRFLALNTQANASNRGFNTMARYKRADFASLTRTEIALEERNHHGDLRDLVLSLSQKLDGAQVMVTLGNGGNLCYREAEGFSEAPALANRVVDTMGAGDAVLSLATIFMAQQAPLEVVGFVANVVGAESVATLGHSSSIEKVALYQHIASLLK